MLAWKKKRKRIRKGSLWKMLRYAASMTETLKFDAEEKIREEGIKEGMEKGEKRKAIEVAKNLLKTGIDIEIIVKSTGLTKEEIEVLREE